MASPTRWIRQAAAIPVRAGRICLVTSSNARRWVVPKGMLEPGKTTGEIALQESWEEAGLVGSLQADPLGTYFYEKYGGTCHVTVFRLDVTEEHIRWPEMNLRRREWLLTEDALDRICEASLRDLIRLVFYGTFLPA